MTHSPAISKQVKSGLTGCLDHTSVHNFTSQLPTASLPEKTRSFPSIIFTDRPFSPSPATRGGQQCGDQLAHTNCREETTLLLSGRAWVGAQVKHTFVWQLAFAARSVTHLLASSPTAAVVSNSCSPPQLLATGLQLKSAQGLTCGLAPAHGLRGSRSHKAGGRGAFSFQGERKGEGERNYQLPYLGLGLEVGYL